MNTQERIEAIRSNYPPENYSELRDALDHCLTLLEAEAGRLLIVMPCRVGAGIYLQIKPPEFCSAIIRGHLVKCPMYDVDGYCSVKGREAYHNRPGTNLGRPDWCPIIPVPNHGDLDRCNLPDTEIEYCDTHGSEISVQRVAGRNQIRNIVAEADIIIPASKEDY